MIRLDAATALLQWATGGLAFLWVTTRRREVGIGYGWLLRSTFVVMALGAVAAGRVGIPVPARDAGALATAAAGSAALVVSVVRRRAGVAGEHARRSRRAARVEAMAGQSPGPEPAPAPEPGAPAPEPAPGLPAPEPAPLPEPAPGRPGEFPPALDVPAPLLGAVGLVAAGLASGGHAPLAVARVLAGAVFLGAVTDAMLLGHWYLVQPGLGRAPLNELVRWVQRLWPVEVAALLWPPGMAQVLAGSIDDRWHGTLGWFWVACAVSTLVLAFVTRAALEERAYSAVMAATGLLYLAILTAFGTDLVARAVLAG